jgi:DNA mismatch repair protein MutL
MADVIQLLPDHVANQIAAGEVVQRPASVVKELLENAIDAGATQIKLIVKDAGKSLIQVIDNGCGMSETDARMCFERHATSKIRTAQDLFAIRTMGFRGEAMASIAAVAQVEMRTRRATDELGTRLHIENSTVIEQELCQAPTGTSVAVKNLFFSVPARRNFLKGDAVEMRHVMDEFQRVALANPDIFFSLHHNEQEIFHLPQGNLRQRIVKIFGEAVNKKLVPVKEETDALNVSGFVGKPDYSKKSRGEQFFFVNNRFIKSAYLHHAVVSAYEDLLPDDAYPLYVIFLELDPAHLDINVHPTKQEIKFDDEKLTYNVLKVSVRHALGSHNVTPTLDFDTEPAFQARPIVLPTPNRQEPGTTDRSFSGNRSNDPQAGRHESNLRNWQKLYEGLDLSRPSDANRFPDADPLPATDGGDTVIVNIDQWLAGYEQPKIESTPPSTPVPTDNNTTFVSAGAGFDLMAIDDEAGSFTKEQKEPYQIHGQYIVSQIKSGFLLIDQQAASERIRYERYLLALRQQPMATQTALFPRTLDLAPADATLFRDMLPQVNQLGFDVAEFGGHSFVIHGRPAEMPENTDEAQLLERMIAQFRNNMDLNLGLSENLARSLARNAALRRGQPLNVREMQDLIDQLFACEIPYKSPFGRNCFITIELEELLKRFG